MVAEPSAPYPMRAPCKWCGHLDGRLLPTNGQNVVRCASCQRACYNAPKTETGEAVRSIASRPNIKPSKRARIIERDNGACVSCHRDDVPLHVGHLLSVKDGHKLGATDEELYSEENLALTCEECNAGFSSRSMSLRLVYRILQARIGWNEQGTG